jgi:hypothetical protein
MLRKVTLVDSGGAFVDYSALALLAMVFIPQSVFLWLYLAEASLYNYFVGFFYILTFLQVDLYQNSIKADHWRLLFTILLGFNQCFEYFINQ